MITFVTGYGTLAIEEDACTKILDEAGFLPTSGIATVNLLDIPGGLNMKEMERFLRENGAKICGSRRDRNPTGRPPRRSWKPGAGLGADYEPIEYPQDWFAGCRGAADHILRAGQFLREREAARHRSR